MTARRWVFFVVFTLTGFSALTLQVVWQRVLSLHSGVDLVSFTTVVAAFLAGLGTGSLVGGWLADRLGPRRSAMAFAVANVGVGLFAWISIRVFYDLYRDQAAALDSTAATFAYNVAFLLVPTTLMGLSLPLVARAVVARVEESGSLVGRLYATNTVGAALGSAVAGWYLLGTFGFEATVRLAGSLNLLAAALVALLVVRAAPAAGPGPVESDGPDEVVEAPGRAWPWYLTYAATGAAALGFEVVFFRLVDTVMRSNSYSFAHVLALYLALFGAGTAIGSRLVRRARQPGTWFLWIQFGVGLGALAGIAALTRLLPAVGFEDDLKAYFVGEGYNVGFRGIDDRVDASSVLLVFGGAPLLIMGLPVLAMGAAYPFAQALVSRRVASLGRHTGRLVAANIAGNVAGTLVVSFVLLDRVGTMGTARLLAAGLGLCGLAAALGAGGDRRLDGRPGAARRAGAAVVATGVLGATSLVVPSNLELWEFLHGAEPGELVLVEDRTCGTALRANGLGGYRLTINGSSQNDYPFDEFHVLIGLLPSLLHDEPSNAMALGLGIGATPYGMVVDPRLDHIDVVEICSGQVPLLAQLAGGDTRDQAAGAPELARLLGDPRVALRTGDGRRFLLAGDELFDVITVDTLRPESAFSGSLYSVEFYELVADRLADDGIMAQWVPTTRALNSATEVFPHLVVVGVPSYNSLMMLGSNAPITLDRDALLERFAATDPAGSFAPELGGDLADFLAQVTLDCKVDAADGPPASVPDDAVNRDLRPRDEYFVNQSTEVEARADTC